MNPQLDRTSRSTEKAQQNAWLFDTIRMYTALNESAPHLVP